MGGKALRTVGGPIPYPVSRRPWTTNGRHLKKNITWRPVSICTVRHSRTVCLLRRTAVGQGTDLPLSICGIVFGPPMGLYGTNSILGNGELPPSFALNM